MARIEIRRTHSMDKAKLRDEVQKLADKLAGELGARYQWQDDTLHFERSGAQGYIEIDADSLKCELKLGMLLSPLKGRIESTINEYLDEHLS